MSMARWLLPAVALGLSSPLSHSAQLLSLDSTGSRAGEFGVSEAFAISADGRFAAFASRASDHVANDTNAAIDLFVHDCMLRTHVWDTTFALSAHSPAGTPRSYPWAFSPDGRYLAFVSAATNLVSGFTFSEAHNYQLYVRDLLSNVTTLVTVSHDGASTADRSLNFFRRRGHVISADGRFVSFSANATNLVALRDANFGADLFCRDLSNGVTELITVAPSRDRTLDSNIGSYFASTNARFFAFDTSATNVVAGLSPTNHFTQVYWHDRTAGTNALVSITWDGAFAFGGGRLIDMSSDGRYVCFQSQATNIVASQNDTVSNQDLFIRDMFLGETWLVSRNRYGQAAGSVDGGEFSANGRMLVFSSSAVDLVNGINGNSSDIYVHYVLPRSNAMVTVSWQGGNGGDSYESFDFANVSATGRYILFTSIAGNLMPGSTTRVQRLYLRDLEANLTLNPLRSPSFPTPAFNYAHTAISTDERHIFFMTHTNFDATITDNNNGVDLYRAPLYQPKFLSAHPMLLDALPNTTYVLESSTNLQNWLPASTNVSDSRGQILYNADASSPARFHRLLWP